MRPFIALSLILAAVSCAQAQDASSLRKDLAWDAIAGYCDGNASLIRDGRAYRLTRGSGILYGDVLKLEPSASCSITFFSGLHFTLAGPARLSVLDEQSRSVLLVDGGEIRVVHDGQVPARVVTSDAEYSLGRTIFRVKKTSAETTAEVEAGVTAISGDQGLRSLPKQKPFIATTGGRQGFAARPARWAIDASQVRLATAVQTSPQLSLPKLDATQAGVPGAVPASPTLPLAMDSSEATQADETSEPDSLFPDEEDPPRIAPIDAPAVAIAGTRGSSGSGLPLPSFSGSSSLGLGSFAGSAGGLFSSGGLFADAGQQTFQGKVTPGDSSFAAGSPFPGAIHLVTAENQYNLQNVTLNASERTAFGGEKYFSIGTGAAPTGQVVTDALTGTSPTPTTFDVTRFDAHVVHLDQYGVPDPARNDGSGLASNIGITGLVGGDPAGPAVVGTAPLVDERARLNGNATFALGEFRVSVDSNGVPTFAIRRSDQDRLIVKDINGNDAEDLVTPNRDVAGFDDTVDARFLPQAPTVKTPRGNEALDTRGTSYSELSFLRRSAFTNVLADTLHDYSRRTGQTRFVVDGRIVDISGYQPTP